MLKMAAAYEAGREAYENKRKEYLDELKTNNMDAVREIEKNVRTLRKSVLPLSASRGLSSSATLSSRMST